MSDNVIQTSFSAGELSPNLFARVDFAKYKSGAATMRNFFVDYRSGASTRAGTEFIRPAVQNGKKIRLVRFQQSTKVTFVLEFGELYLRFITQGASVVQPPFAIAAIANAASFIISAPGNNFNNGDLVFVSGGSSPPQMLNRYFVVSNNFGGIGSVELVDSLTQQAVNSTNWAAYSGGSIIQRVHTISTPYLADELPLLKFSQNASQMNITHPNHPPYILTLISATNWTLAPAVFGASLGPPGITSVTKSADGSTFQKYAITSVDEKGQESVPSPTSEILFSADARITPSTHTVNWHTVPGAVSYNVYGSSVSYLPLNPDTGGLGFMGSTPANVLMFVDTNIAPDFTSSPPIHEDPFNGIPAVHPQVSSYFQQRLVYANGGTGLDATFWMSKTGAPYNFDVSNPVQANDAITGSLVSLEVNEIKSMVPMPSGLLMLTTKGVWLVSGGAGGVAAQGGPITAATVTATPQAYVGANDVPPLLINYDLIFVQSKGSIVRDLTYNIYANIYTGNDISILSSHLFYGHQILEWAYAEEPFKAVWAVREDGILLSLTLVKEQEMYGWARHDTRGNFISVCTVTEGQTDATYVAVERPSTVPGSIFSAMCIERIADRTFPYGAEDAWCVDSGVKNIPFTPNADLIMAVNLANNTFFAFATTPSFSAGTVGAIIKAGGGQMKVTVFSSPQGVGGDIIQPIINMLPNDPENRPDRFIAGSWSITQPFQVVHGLDHLEGQKVSVLADGGVVNGMTVVDGSVTLPAPVTTVIVGYGFQAQLQTMPLDVGSESNTAQGKRKKISALTVRVKDSRAIKAGSTFKTLTPLKELNRVTEMGFPIKLITADERIVMDPSWNVDGQICLQVDDPLPATVLGVIPEVTMGDK